MDQRPVAVVIAWSVADGQAWVEQQPVFPFRPVFVTPRSRGAARGQTAVAVFTTPAVRGDRLFDELLAESVPATFWLGAR